MTIYYLTLLFIFTFESAALLIQTSKMGRAIKDKKPYGLNGISFWAFAFWTFFIIPGVVWQVFHKKDFGASLLYVVSLFGFFIPCTILIILYQKNQGYVKDDTSKEDPHITKSKEISPNEWKRSMGIFIGLTIISIVITAVTYPKTKLFREIALISSVGVGLCFLPFTIHIFRYGDKGVSILFLVLTLIGNFSLMIGDFGINWVIVILMAIYVILKGLCFGKMYAIAQKDRVASDGSLKTADGMKKMLGLLIGASVGFGGILFLTHPKQKLI
jgi:hypothetical protein